MSLSFNKKTTVIAMQSLVMTLIKKQRLAVAFIRASPMYAQTAYGEALTLPFFTILIQNMRARPDLSSLSISNALKI
jgi:hypothetical protein